MILAITVENALIIKKKAFSVINKKNKTKLVKQEEKITLIPKQTHRASLQQTAIRITETEHSLLSLQGQFNKRVM